MKSQLKKFLKSKGVNAIKDERGNKLNLSQARTADLIKAAGKLGYND